MNQTKIWATCKYQKTSLSPFIIFFAALSTAKQQQIICHCTAEAQRETVGENGRLLVKFTSCTFRHSGFNMMHNTQQHNGPVSVYKEMKCNWLLGYKVEGWFSVKCLSQYMRNSGSPWQECRNISCHMTRHHPLIFKSQLNFWLTRASLYLGIHSRSFDPSVSTVQSLQREKKLLKEKKRKDAAEKREAAESLRLTPH